MNKVDSIKQFIILTEIIAVDKRLIKGFSPAKRHFKVTGTC